MMNSLFRLQRNFDSKDNLIYIMLHFFIVMLHFVLNSEIKFRILSPLRNVIFKENRTLSESELRTLSEVELRTLSEVELRTLSEVEVSSLTGDCILRLRSGSN